MEVILLDDVPDLGEAGDIVRVKDGYGRNYLIPQGLAQMASRDGLNRIESIRRAGEERRMKRVSEVKDKVAAVDGRTISVPMKVGGETKIFGAVTSLLLSEKIKEQFDLDIDRRYIMLEEPIKYLGTYEVKLKAGAEAESTLTVEVLDESAQAEEQKEPPKPEQAPAEPAEADAESEKPSAEGEGAEEAPPDEGPPAEAALEDEGSRIEEQLSG
jgi:large subunit ribosomal protein L9